MGYGWVSFATLVAILIVLLHYYLKRKYSFWERQGVYSEPVNLLFGNITDVLMQRQTIGVAFKEFYLRLRKNGLNYGGFYNSVKPIFVPADLDLVHDMMTKDFTHFTDHSFDFDESIEPLANHIFNLKGQKWRNMRTKLTPTFTSGKMKMMFSTLVQSAHVLEDVLNKVVQDRQPAVIKEISSRFTTDVIMSCAFGLEANCQTDPDAEFRKYGTKVFESTLVQGLVRFIATLWPKVLSILRVSPLPKDVSIFFKNSIRSVVKYREDNNVIRKDFMHLLIQLKNNVNISHDDIGDLKGDADLSNRNITMDELMAQAFVFWIAGYETSSTTTSYCMFELAQNTHIQQKLRDEIKTVLGKHKGEVTYEALKEMTFMNQCVNETLRKYPPVPIHTRNCTETYEVPNSDVVLNKKDPVFIPIYGIQNDPDIWPEPDKFDPERFTPENVAGRHPAAWMPFGDGPRLCIGLRFGMMQTKMALLTMLQNFKYTINNKTQLPLQFDPNNFILSTKNSILLDVQKI